MLPAFPPLVLLPGTLCDRRVFAPLISALEGEFRGLATDVIMTPHHATIRSAAEHVLAMAPAKFALLGFSLGGILALEIALLAPDRVLGLALLSVNSASAPLSVRTSRRAAVQQAKSMGHANYVCQHLWSSYVAASSIENADLLALIADMAHDLGHAAFSSQTEAALTRREYRPLLSTLTMTTLVQAGELDSVCPTAAQRQLAQAIPHAVFDVIPGAGHFSLLERQDVVAASVAGWFHTVAQQFHPLQENQ